MQRLAALAIAVAFAHPSLAQVTPLHILPIGDSITQGGRAGIKEYTYRWPLVRMLSDEGVCFDFIGSQHAGLDAGARWPGAWNDAHEGYYGAKTAAVFGYLAVSLPNLPLPDVALVHLGTNDRDGSVDVDVIDPMRGIVSLLRKANPQVKVFLGLIPVGMVHGVYLHYRMNQLAEELDTKASPVIAVDQYSGWSTADDTYDGVHPNLVGQRWQAERWILALQPYLPPAGAGCEGAANTSPNH